MLTSPNRSPRKRVESFEDLEVYRTAFELQQQIFRATQSFPKAEAYALTDQVRRSSRSIGANLAEAWAKRRYPAHFLSKLTDADGEQNETRHWLGSAFACGYFVEETYRELSERCKQIGAMLGKMIVNSNQWTLFP